MPLVLPDRLEEVRRTPVFDRASLPPALTRAHHTSVWAQLCVEEGVVRFLDLAGPHPRDVRVRPGEALAIAPDVPHRVEPSDDARFHVRFYR